MTRRTLGRMAAALLAAPFAAGFAALATVMLGIALDSRSTTVPLPYAALAGVLFGAFEAASVFAWIAIVEEPPGGRP